MRRSARKRFNSHSSTPRAEIQKTRSFNPRRENIEQRLAQTIRSRPRSQRRRTLQSSSAIFAGNNAHKHSSADYADCTDKTAKHSSLDKRKPAFAEPLLPVLKK